MKSIYLLTGIAFVAMLSSAQAATEPSRWMPLYSKPPAAAASTQTQGMPVVLNGEQMRVFPIDRATMTHRTMPRRAAAKAIYRPAPSAVAADNAESAASTAANKAGNGLPNTDIIDIFSAKPAAGLY